jgi:hypothetical protein
VIKSHDVGMIQYIEWLILIDRVQPSFIAGVIPCTLCNDRGRPQQCQPLSHSATTATAATTATQPLQCTSSYSLAARSPFSF